MKRTNKSMFGWVKKLEATQTLPMNDAQKETDYIEWEEMEREEKLDRVS